MARQPRSVRTARDNARARSLGYQSYYDFRAHDYGRIPPAQPRARGETLARLRGHRSAADLERLLRSGRVELVNLVTTVQKGKRVVDVLCTLDDGSTVEFMLRGAQIRRFGDIIDDLGIDAPMLVGSPRTIQYVQGDIDRDEFEQAPTQTQIVTRSGRVIDVTGLTEE